MYFTKKIKLKYKDEQLIIFVDMDGVIADYQFQEPLNFKNKRPIKTNIATFEQLSKLPNIELYILSICKKEYQVAEKKEWLNKYAPFFKEENIIIIFKDNNNQSSKNLKHDFLKRFSLKETKKQIILIDDDNEILKYISKKLTSIHLFQDSSIID